MIEIGTETGLITIASRDVEDAPAGTNPSKL
jgi:hypothetical protein